MDGRRGSPALAGVLRARRHPHPGDRFRARFAGISRHGFLARGDVRARGDQRGHHGVERRADGSSVAGGFSSSPVALPWRNWGFGCAYHRRLSRRGPVRGYGGAEARSRGTRRRYGPLAARSRGDARLRCCLLGCGPDASKPRARRYCRSYSAGGWGDESQMGDRRGRFHRRGRSARADDPSGPRRGRLRRALQRR